MLEVKQIGKRFSGFHLEEISFSLPPGYIMGVIGANGSGKSTLLSIISGLYTMDAGSVCIGGYDLVREEKAAKNKIGFVFSEELFQPALSLLENARYYGRYYDAFEEAVFLQFCKEFSLDASQRLRRQSKGEKLKFQYAFALSHNPELLVIDEASASFDPEFREAFLRTLTQFVADGAHSVVLCTHLLEELEQIADYITFLDKGKLVLSLEKELLYDSYRLVMGEDYKINLIPKERMVAKEKGSYATKALVRHNKYITYDAAVSVERPTLSDLMYYTVKGGLL
ncbi:MAG: type transport system ATP-binding protein [Clostridiales bacterium]|nr:type transport system ATP-binding protein [Clostridiales bacterium]